METRKITVVSTKNQKKSVIMSAATTLAELKSDLRQNGIDYDGMTFYEGTSKTELKTDESVLPHDVPYKGTTTNELVFMLTNTNKKIKSGAMSRKEVYNKITELGLQDECKKKFGRNFTQCTTADLISLVEKASKKSASAHTSKVEKPAPTPVEEEVKKDINTSEEVEAPTPTSTSTKVEDTEVRITIAKLATMLNNKGIINTTELHEILVDLGEITGISVGDYKPSNGSPYSDDEIDNMFNFVK